MPLYDFKCPSCGIEKEFRLSADYDEPPRCAEIVLRGSYTYGMDHELCDALMRRIWKPGGSTLLKGLENTKS